MYTTIVIGGGASGMMAAYSAAKRGNNVILLEKNEKLGKKIYITGKGRCNLTANVSVAEFMSNVVRNPKFLYGAINALSPKDTMDFFEEIGLKVKTERGNRVFPLSDKASDVTKVLEKNIRELGVDIKLNVSALSIIVAENAVKGVITSIGEIPCDNVIVCCGGISYPLTGSTGDGYKFAQKAGHKITDLKPGLVGLELCGSDFVELQGVSLKNVRLTAVENDKTLFTDFGEMLFTHYGVSGPLILSCSSVINRNNLSSIKLFIDLKPALNSDMLNKRLIREFKENNAKKITSAMRALLPASLIKTVLRQAKIDIDKNCSEITVEERTRIVSALKNLAFLIKKLRPVEEAVITSGGVCVKEINPKTMESKLINGLFFAGEVIDVDAFTGGFNLQIAFSTGYVAGQNC